MPQDQVTSASTPVPTRSGTLEHETERLNVSLTELRDLIDRLGNDLLHVLELEPPAIADPGAPDREQHAPVVEKIVRLEEGARSMIAVVRSLRSRLLLS